MNSTHLAKAHFGMKLSMHTVRAMPAVVLVKEICCWCTLSGKGPRVAFSPNGECHMSEHLLYFLLVAGSGTGVS